MESVKVSSLDWQSGADGSGGSIANQPLWRSGAVAGGLLLLSAASTLLLDHPCAGFLRRHVPSGEVMNLFQAVEHFGTPYGALLVLITAWIIVPQVRTRVVRTISAAIAAGLLADGVKLCVSRTRPGSFDFDQSILSSFHGLFQWGAGGSGQQSFPSAHTAFAVSFAVLLGEMFPVARRWFLGLAAMVAMQRVLSSAHYPSDAFAGAAIGFLTARCYAGTTFISRICEIVEARLFREPIPNFTPDRTDRNVCDTEQWGSHSYLPGLQTNSETARVEPDSCPALAAQPLALPSVMLASPARTL